jgi:predicted CXXCH cytochrome family protein
MKLIKFSFIVAIAVAACFGLAGTGYAFHDGGVATCDSCHTMHNSLFDKAMVGTGSNNGSKTKNVDSSNSTAVLDGEIYLLQGSDQSSTCLNCHQGSQGSYRVSSIVSSFNTASIPQQITPGGDFTWLKVGANASSKMKRGHNVVAADFGYVADTNKADNLAPGGTYPAGNLHCSSCHDPHGKYRRTTDTNAFATTGAPIAESGSYATSPDPTGTGHAVGSYRFLGGVGYEPKSTPGFAFTAGPPMAVAPSSYNRSEYSTGASANFETHVAYGAGMSEWCANCHSSMHQPTYTSGNAGQVHPAGNNAKLTATIAGNYNSYVTSGVTGGGNHYTTLVPFETGAGTFSELATRAGVTAGNTDVAAGTGSNVMCLSCHRAHASGFNAMLRYPTTDLLTGDAAEGYEAIDGLNDTQMERAMNGRPATVFGQYQRALCNKCHAKD